MIEAGHSSMTDDRRLEVISPVLRESNAKDDVGQCSRGEIYHGDLKNECRRIQDPGTSEGPRKSVGNTITDTGTVTPSIGILTLPETGKPLTFIRSNSYPVAALKTDREETCPANEGAGTTTRPANQEAVWVGEAGGSRPANHEPVRVGENVRPANN